MKVCKINGYFTIPERGPQDTENKFKKINIDNLECVIQELVIKNPTMHFVFLDLIYWQDFKNSFRHCKNRVCTLSAWKSSPISILEYFAGRNVLLYLFELFFITCIARSEFSFYRADLISKRRLLELNQISFKSFHSSDYV